MTELEKRFDTDQRRCSAHIGKIKAVALALALASGAANADLLEYTFTGKDGAQRTVPADHIYVNAVGSLKMALSAGLDRRVRASIVKADGSVVSTATSKLLAAEDQIIVDGQKTYGAVVEVAAPSEGTYTIQAEILGAWSNSIQVDEYPLIIDLTAPTISGAILSEGHDGHSNIGRGPYAHLNMVGPTGTRSIFVDGATDPSGIDSVVFQTFEPNKPVIASVPGEYSEVTKRASVRSDYFKFFPKSGINYTLQFLVTDRAGNTKAIARTVSAGSCSAIQQPIPVAQLKPGHGGSFAGQAGFVTWSNGGPIYRNPVKTIWRVPNSSLYPANKYGIINFSAFHNDGTYSYQMIEKPYANRPDLNNGNWSTAGQWGCKAWDDIQGYFTAGVPTSPEGDGFAVKLAGLNWSARFTNPNPVVAKVRGSNALERLKVYVKPQGYTQNVSSYAASIVPNTSRSTLMSASCTVPAWQNSCDLILNLSRPSTSSVIYLPVHVGNSNNSIVSFSGIAHIMWDATRRLSR